MSYKDKESLCLFCKNACTGECSWARSFKPVKGWSAVPTKVKISKGVYDDSFLVESCPKYIQDDRKEVMQVELAKALNIGVKRLLNSSLKEINKLLKLKDANYTVTFSEPFDFCNGTFVRIMK